MKASQPDVHLPLTLSNSSVQVTAYHPLTNGQGWLVRLFNGSDHAQSLTVGWQGANALHLAQTDLWGNGGAPVSSELSLAPLQTVTIRVMP